jgi:hypothetical protein
MVVLRKKLPSKVAEGTLEVATDQTLIELSNTIPKTEDSSRLRRDESTPAEKMKGLAIQTSSQFPDQGHTPESTAKDFAQSPLSTSTSHDFPQSPMSMSDALFSSPVTTLSDTFFQTPGTSINGDDFVQSSANVPSTSESPIAEKAKSKWVSAIEDARIFAGGLLRHPFESTKHFTILRHSYGLVYYKGPSTSVAITIFADKPIPRDRRLWLQMKGWTGKTGMRAKALLRTNGSWIKVNRQRE